MSTRPIAAIILAAGQGTRMKSDLHKVLHPLAGRPMLLHLLAAVEALGAARKVVVVGARREQVEAAVAGSGVAVAVQAEQRGTADAVRAAHDALGDFEGDVLILYGDVPLVETATMAAMLDALTPDVAAVVLGFRPADPGAYGRIVATAGIIDKMVEYKDASDAERAIDLCNSGLMAARSADLWPLLARVGNANAAGEYYLPDIVGLADRPSRIIETAADEVAGVNSRGELAGVEAAWQAKRRVAMMAAGVTLIAPDTVWFAHDTTIDRDVTIEPNVFFGTGVTIASGATIRGFSHIEGAAIGRNAEVGPFARLRPGAQLGAKSKVGNFVEVKKAKLAEGAKVNHLSYIGDADIGAGANIGAGTITCNYDGFFKYRTSVGAGAFIGSNSALVAPVTIGAGAIVAAGSTITADVPADALALVRPLQVAKAGWAARFRGAMTARKAGK
ncbi:bifunctional UDP-N-acetylglucosamine diphosphorylase/glucosamine-1-phosphate N-acetyltransferase GlmU [Polymorphobacter sp. PAMC 29334]|uniref:bifunctional UDP-N-acetylglucosamine diphosphorylase/glucosamine-1-phosphate N-acetyltransferase GlmU n=1 Tax=Polymorphobacter sp. PAMC 29334 TaxID=2862331 RepID=UPI001C75AC25|nr:bifunctional UDP-N-acetylglucosamine diphosphorylase/glucosamine-1-phosphate N-acetyltransferase GlmU [Polymorphobacter sp. PAMC 29334]QYE34353.1 bifunctional UDP-N-acetylglucosamine diphosphorylase/glucosamine-1-phosphate N-acetyltransferase GlmU [Polymorphobacter sp. PAMC 29334]